MMYLHYEGKYEHRQSLV